MTNHLAPDKAVKVFAEKPRWKFFTASYLKQVQHVLLVQRELAM